MNGDETVRLVKLIAEMTKLLDGADQYHATKMIIAIAMGLPSVPIPSRLTNQSRHGSTRMSI